MKTQLIILLILLSSFVGTGQNIEPKYDLTFESVLKNDIPKRLQQKEIKESIANRADTIDVFAWQLDTILVNLTKNQGVYKFINPVLTTEISNARRGNYFLKSKEVKVIDKATGKNLNGFYKVILDSNHFYTGYFIEGTPFVNLRPNIFIYYRDGREYKREYYKFPSDYSSMIGFNSEVNILPLFTKEELTKINNHYLRKTYDWEDYVENKIFFDGRYKKKRGKYVLLDGTQYGYTKFFRENQRHIYNEIMKYKLNKLVHKEEFWVGWEKVKQITTYDNNGKEVTKDIFFYKGNTDLDEYVKYTRDGRTVLVKQTVYFEDTIPISVEMIADTNAVNTTTRYNIYFKKNLLGSVERVKDLSTERTLKLTRYDGLANVVGAVVYEYDKSWSEKKIIIYDGARSLKYEIVTEVSPKMMYYISKQGDSLRTTLFNYTIYNYTSSIVDSSLLTKYAILSDSLTVRNADGVPLQSSESFYTAGSNYKSKIIIYDSLKRISQTYSNNYGYYYCDYQEILYHYTSKDVGIEEKQHHCYSLNGKATSFLINGKLNYREKAFALENRNLYAARDILYEQIRCVIDDNSNLSKIVLFTPFDGELISVKVD